MLELKKNLKLPFDPYLILVFLLITCKLQILIKENSLELFRGVFFINICLIILLLAPAYCFQTKARKLYLYFVDFGLTLLLVTDLLYIRYFGAPISINIFFQASNLSGLGPSILNLCELKDLIFIGDLLILPFIFCFISRKVNKSNWLFLRELVIGLVLIGIIIQCNYLDGRLFTRYSSKDTLHFFGPIGYHVMDIAYFVNDRSLKLTPDVETEIFQWFKEKNKNNDNNRLPYKAVGKGKNLILIQLESFQNFVVGLKINNTEVTPILNKLIGNSLYFPNYYPQTVSGNSSDAELLTNTSLYPIKKGSTFFKYSANKYYSLPILLKEKGYNSVAIHGDEAGYWNRDKVYPNLGFDTYYSEEKMADDELIGMGLSDEAMFKQAVSIIKDLTQPFYSFIVTLTSHYPFWLPTDKVFIDLPAPLSQSHLGNYLRSVHYADMALGQFIQDLEDEGLLEDTVIAIYGDHDGLWKRDKPEIERFITNSTITEEEWIRNYVPVPLLIYNWGQEGKRIDVYGGQVDFFPTISYFMGLDSNSYKYSMGHNLFANNGYAIIPSGDYNAQTMCVSEDEIITNLSSKDKLTLKISDLIIRTNFFECSELKPYSELKP